jgi:hypothetical protein
VQTTTMTISLTCRPKVGPNCAMTVFTLVQFSLSRASTAGYVVISSLNYSNIASFGLYCFTPELATHLLLHPTSLRHVKRLLHAAPDLTLRCQRRISSFPQFPVVFLAYIYRTQRTDISSGHIWPSCAIRRR